MNTIVGICLFKNEDIYCERVVSNILDFCDKILIIDNESTDKTLDIVSNKFGRNPKVTIIKCSDHTLTGRYTYEYFKTKSFLFAVDGDEIYDPVGLSKIREKIKNGDYDNCWKISGSSFHVEEWNEQDDTPNLSGFTCPPNKHVVKLYNFNVIESWTQGERLHGAGPSPYPNYIEENIKVKFANESGQTESQIVPWGFSNLKCLHMCFVPRSSKDLEIRESCNVPDSRSLANNSHSKTGDSTTKNLKYRPAPEGHDLDYKPKKYGSGNTHKLPLTSLKNFLA